MVALFEYLQRPDVDGHMLSPAYGRAAVARRDVFLTRDEIRAKFAGVDRLFRRFWMKMSPVHADSLRGGWGCAARLGAIRPATREGGRGRAT